MLGQKHIKMDSLNKQNYTSQKVITYQVKNLLFFLTLVFVLIDWAIQKWLVHI